VSLAGRLEDLRLPELLQVLALGGKSGKLELTRPDGFGLIVLRRGKIIYAVCNGVRETFGHLLVCRGLVDEPTLARALDRQHRARPEKRLGAILVELGVLDAAAVEAVIGEQTRAVVAELFAWPGGFFRFDPAEFPDRGEVEVDARDLVMREGVNGEQLAIDVLARTTGEAIPRGRRYAPRPPTGAEAGAPASLGSIVREMHTPAFTGEHTDAFMRAAARLVKRGVMFAVRRGVFLGMGQFGLGGDAEPPDERVRRLAVPLTERSVLAIAADRRAPYRGPLDDTPWNRRLWTQLGGGRAAEAVVVSILARGEVAAVFYGDNVGGGGPLSCTRDLELLALEAGAALGRGLTPRPARGASAASELVQEALQGR
jgi:hypothetical protein